MIRNATLVTWDRNDPLPLEEINNGINKCESPCLREVFVDGADHAVLVCPSNIKGIQAQQITDQIIEEES